ncbi:uracil-DNA glycosylase [Alteromonas oceanisediminis]|uniref:uracil-DNA glycosylase n=1 Tax=Alteromonas oceanisediminis TaxID=2836180 RepID=UPI001BDB0039|nr:uracil-DNA glycosylase [Alteromonas oceanisediminis]MBT0585484.1 uracil-DNA glycosylase [Alteromonas oceanisediminis]
MATTWSDVLGDEKQQPYFVEMMQELARRRAAGEVIYPPKESVFSAFSSTPFENVKVVILGQDPYHGPNQAHGLCFSVQQGVKPPPSLVNIFKELQHEFNGFSMPAHGNLQAWAAQGVLLLNTVLTVQAGQAHSHAKLGWERFTDTVITALNRHSTGVVFLLWGGHAQRKASQVEPDRHCILTAPHPSPLSAYRGFIGCGHFRQANDYLIQQGKAPINWQL